MGAIYIKKAVKEETSVKKHKVAEALGGNDRTRGPSTSGSCQLHCIHPASKLQSLSLCSMWEHPDQSRKEGLDGSSCEKLLTYPQLALKYAFKNLEDLPATI